MALYLGTSEADTIRGAILPDKNAQIDAGEGDDVVYLEQGQTFLIGQGNDTVYGSKTGRAWYNSVNSKLPVVIDVELGKVTSDGFGNQDLIYDIDAFQLGSNSIISFGSKNGVVSLNGSGSTIYAGSGQVTVQFFANSYDCTLTENTDGSFEVLNNKTQEVNYVYDRPTIQFNDKSINTKVSVNDFSSKFWAEQSFDRSSMGSSITQLINGSLWPGICTIETADLNADGKLEIIFHLQVQGGSWGGFFNGPTPNGLLILGQNKNGEYTNITNSVIQGTTALTGWSRQVTNCDLNGDGLSDIIWAVNKEDGRNGQSDNTAQTGILLSNSQGKYDLVDIGDINWFHAIGGAPLLLNGNKTLPGIVLASGFQGPPIAVIFQADGSYKTEKVPGGLIGAGTLEYLPSLDDFSTGDRYFVGQTVNEDPCIVKRDINGLWSITSHFDEAFRDTSVIKKYISYNNEEASVMLYQYGDFQISGSQYTEASVWHQYPNKKPIAVLKLAAGIPADSNATVLVQNDELPVVFLNFFNLDNGLITKSTAKVFNEEYVANANFMDTLDFNCDGYEDLIVYPYSGQWDSPLAIIYLNDNKGNLYRADTNSYIPQPNGFWGEASKIADLNDDGVYDFLVYTNGGINSLPERLNQFHIYYGTTKFSTGPNFTNPADQGAPGFNEHYYLDSHPDVAALVANGTYATGLAHFLAIGKSLNYESFAPDINVWGSDNNLYDVLTLNSPSSTFTVNLVENTSLVDSKGQYGTLKLNGIEKLQFTDRSVIIESKSHSSYADLPTELYQFFITAFNAAPGVTYMDQLAEAYRWFKTSEANPVKKIVDIFTTKEQFTDVYSPSLSHQDMATQLVNNIVKNSATTTAKSEAIADIKGALDIGWTVGDVIYTVFGNLAHKSLNDNTWGNTARQFNNEIAVAKYYTEVLNQSTTDLETLRDVIQPVTQSTDVSSDVVVAQLIGVSLMTGGLGPGP
jgi:hypothetical protein